MSKGKAKKSSKSSSSGQSLNNGQTQPQFIMDDVKLLFNSLTTPETGVQFNPPSRANPATLQNNIHPPMITWTWKDPVARGNEKVTQGDLEKYGIETDTNILFRLTSVDPVVWQPVQTVTTPTWTWANLAARNATAKSVTPDDIGKIGVQTDINTLFQLTSAVPTVWQPVPNPTNTSSPFELSTGASDADSYHDFFRLQIAFGDVWAELLDQRIPLLANKLYAQWDTLYAQWNSLMDPNLDDTGQTDRGTTFASHSAPVDDIKSADELQNFIDGLKVRLGIGNGASASSPVEIRQLTNDFVQAMKGCNMLLQQLNSLGVRGPVQVSSAWDASWLTDTNATAGDMSVFPPNMERQQVFTSILTDLQSFSPSAPSAPDVPFPDLKEQLTALDDMLNENYRFDVFAPASINYGLLLNYRQRWQPQSYQVGNLVSTIPLAPQETRRYTTKTVIKKTRNVKEIDDSLRSGKDESSDTWRVDSEIVDRAKNQTNFQKNASGSFGNDNLYKVSAGMQQGQDQAVESAQTKREFHESVVKSAQEYRNEHRLEITTEESREDESTTYREIRNPNDELTVTYLFYELQRRYLVDEALHKITPVVLVANDVPGPHEVTQSWILRHDWIIKRAILDDSFLPALEYLSTNYTGEELTLQVLGLAVEQQKAVVDKISQQVQVANQLVNTAAAGLERAESQQVQDLQNQETAALAKSFFDPLGLTQGGKQDGNSDRARLDFAKDALNRAQAKANQLLSQLKTETTALQVAIDKYTAAANKHFSMLADIERLRVHVKDNIIYYMQAIWTYEAADQRYFRLYNLDVPVFTHNSTAGVQRNPGLHSLDSSRTTVEASLPPPTLADGTLKLYQVADLENLIGFKGNYMIFPMVHFNYMTWFMMQDYLHLDDTTVTAQDPDPLAGVSVKDLRSAYQTIYAKNPASFTAPQTVTDQNTGQPTQTTNQQVFEEIMTKVLSTQSPEMVIVPSNSLYIEALPGTHPLLEDFKLIHRAIDVKKAQAEARHAELENLRLGARLGKNTLGDPDIEKVVVVGSGQNVTVDAGQ
jgi:hypothetical protein